MAKEPRRNFGNIWRALENLNGALKLNPAMCDKI